MASADDLRTAALALPEASEQDHFGVPSWRVRGKIFAQLVSRPQMAVLKLSAARREWLFEARPDAFTPAHWGRQVYCEVHLAELDASELADLTAEAWGETAPKSLVRLRSGGA